MKKALMRADVPDLPDVYVPFGKAADRAGAGQDVTIVAWGRAVWTAMAAAEALAKGGRRRRGDRPAHARPARPRHGVRQRRRTGRLLVAAEDRSFAGFVRHDPGPRGGAMPGMPTRALGQKNVPGIAQSVHLEDAVILTREDVERGARELVDAEVAAGPQGFAFVPPRYFVS
jgi:pyruvate/2-oxoglutarate/acetoin dehydrogenase E1 component